MWEAAITELPTNLLENPNVTAMFYNGQEVLVKSYDLRAFTREDLLARIEADRNELDVLQAKAEELSGDVQPVPEEAQKVLDVRAAEAAAIAAQAAAEDEASHAT